MIVLRILLYILLGLIGLLALLFSLHLKFYLQLEDELTIHAGLGPIVLKLAPKKPRKPIDLADFTYEKHQKRLAKEAARRKKQSARKADKAAKKAEAKRLAAEAEKKAAVTEEAESGDKLASVLALLSFIFEELPRFASSFKTEIRSLTVTVGGKDADHIARSYGKISALVALLIELLESKTAMKPVQPGIVQVYADFIAPKTTYRMHIRIRLRLFSIVRVGWHTLVWFIKQKIRENKR